MAETSDARHLARFEDRRMWRLLLARLHPDAGGDHELFTFACALRDELLGTDLAGGRCEQDDTPCRTQHPPVPFLRTWQEAMSRWSYGNHDALRNSKTP